MLTRSNKVYKSKIWVDPKYPTVEELRPWLFRSTGVAAVARGWHDGRETQTRVVGWVRPYVRANCMVLEFSLGSPCAYLPRFLTVMQARMQVSQLSDTYLICFTYPDQQLLHLHSSAKAWTNAWFYQRHWWTWWSFYWGATISLLKRFILPWLMLLMPLLSFWLVTKFLTKKAEPPFFFNATSHKIYSGSLIMDAIKILLIL
jgi:hypothetical protein